MIVRSSGSMLVGERDCPASQPQPSRALAPALQQAPDSAARFIAACRGREILEVDDERVGTAVQHGSVRLRVGTGPNSHVRFKSRSAMGMGQQLEARGSQA